MLFFYLSVVTFIFGIGVDMYRIAKRNNLSIRRHLWFVNMSNIARALSIILSIVALVIGTTGDAWKSALMICGGSIVLMLTGAIASSDLIDKMAVKK